MTNATHFGFPVISEGNEIVILVNESEGRAQIATEEIGRPGVYSYFNVWLTAEQAAKANNNNGNFIITGMGSKVVNGATYYFPTWNVWD